MDDMKQNNLAIKLLKLLRVWLDDIIPEETKNCIRSKSALVVKVNSGGSYNVVLSEELDTYHELEEKKNDGTLTPTQFDTEVAKISIDDLFTIKNETYVVNDFVIVGYLDNKLTNAFILCKNKK